MPKGFLLAIASFKNAWLFSHFILTNSSVTGLFQNFAPFCTHFHKEPISTFGNNNHSLLWDTQTMVLFMHKLENTDNKKMAKYLGKKIFKEMLQIFLLNLLPYCSMVIRTLERANLYFLNQDLLNAVYSYWSSIGHDSSEGFGVIWAIIPTIPSE